MSNGAKRCLKNAKDVSKTMSERELRPKPGIEMLPKPFRGFRCQQLTGCDPQTWTPELINSRFWEQMTPTFFVSIACMWYRKMSFSISVLFFRGGLHTKNIQKQEKRCTDWSPYSEPLDDPIPECVSFTSISISHSFPHLDQKNWVQPTAGVLNHQNDQKWFCSLTKKTIWPAIKNWWVDLSNGMWPKEWDLEIWLWTFWPMSKKN